MSGSKVSWKCRSECDYGGTINSDYCRGYLSTPFVRVSSTCRIGVRYLLLHHPFLGSGPQD